MKTILTAIFCCFLVYGSAAVAREEDESSPPTSVNEMNPRQEFVKLIECQATDLTLSHLYLQISASMSTLSGSVGQSKLKTMIQGFNDLAVAERQKVDDISKVINEAVVPQLAEIGLKDVKKNGEIILDKLLTKMSGAIADPTNDEVEEMEIQNSFLSKSNQCEDMMNKIRDKHTF